MNFVLKNIIHDKKNDCVVSHLLALQCVVIYNQNYLKFVTLFITPFSTSYFYAVKLN